MSKLDPMTALSATAIRLRRKVRECRESLAAMGADRTTQRSIMEARMFAYSEEAERVENLIDVCKGEASTGLSRGFDVADLHVYAPVAAETGIDVLPPYVSVESATVDEDAPTLPLMPRSGLTPSC